uniref:Putative single-stranded DNA-binding protein n=1 Tax=viral metagenome TaxID=1070528 RepID=A0A6M3LJL5_9ZZZZ
MASLNRVMLIGNVGSEPEMRFTSSGNAVANFSVAVNDKVGEDEHTEWFKVVAWKKLAEICNQYLSKGRQVYVEGRLQTQKWDSEDGQTHYKTEVVANRVLFLGKRDEQEQSDEPTEDSEITF